MHLAGVGDDAAVHLVAGDADGPAHDHAAEGDDGDLGSAAADVDDHAAGRFHDGEARADGGGEGLLDEEAGAGAGAERGIVNRAFLDLRDAAGDADDDTGLGEEGAVLHGADEVAEHPLRDLEVGDHAVAQRTHGDDVGGGAADHALRLFADGEDALGGAVDSDDGGLDDDDAPSPDHDERVRRPQVDGDVVGQEAEETRERAEACQRDRSCRRPGLRSRELRCLESV